jgi:D-glycero-alpha-D-manno-heptose-7-phosphate kinase
MIISRTPFRISFFGGGTDYPEWFTKHGGAVLATTIDKYCYITCRYLPPFFDHRYRLIYREIENCGTVDEIKHPGIRETLKYLGIHRGLEIHHDADLPARSGIGSSSAFTVGLLSALHALAGAPHDAHAIASQAIWIEREKMQECVGHQDQMITAYGGLNFIQFLSDSSYRIKELTISEEFENHLMLVYTRRQRTASDIAQTYVKLIDHEGLDLERTQEYANAGLAALLNEDWIWFGKILHESWLLKRQLPGVTTPEIDEIYAEGRRAGAIGGKLLGAGGGGFMVFFVPPEKQDMVREKLSRLVHVPFKFESSGSQIIFNAP